MRKLTDFFQVGGTLSADAPSYIERPADKELLNTLERGKLCLVLVPEEECEREMVVEVKWEGQSLAVPWRNWRRLKLTMKPRK